MNSLLNLLLYICFFPMLLFIVITINTIYNKIICLILKREFKPNEELRNLFDYKEHPIILTLLFLLCIFYTLFSNPVFTNAIGRYDLETSKSGEYCYFVELTNSNNKTYTLPAKIVVDICEYEDNEGNTESYKSFYIKNIYWSNGGYLTFEDEVLDIDEATTIIDTHNREYKCTLLNKHAYTDKFQETQPSTFYYYELFGLLFCIIFTWIYSIKLSIGE